MVRKDWGLKQDQLPTTHPITAEIRDLADVEVNFDGITYAKGASVLRQLVSYVGRDAFFAGLHEYLTSTPTPTPRWMTCSPSWLPRRVATWRPGRRCGWRRRA